MFMYRHVLMKPMVVAGDIVRARRGRRLPVVLSVREVRAILEQMRGVPRLCATLMYGSGLRLSECLSLRVKDLDFDHAEIVVGSGKGDKDRRVPLPKLAVPALKVHLERRQRGFDEDLRAGPVGGSPCAATNPVATGLTASSWSIWGESRAFHNAEDAARAAAQAVPCPAAKCTAGTCRGNCAILDIQYAYRFLWTNCTVTFDVYCECY